MPRASHRDKIIAAGVSVFESHGYHGSSVRDIVAEAGVPMGSFTNHFRSKELFALLVIDRNFGRLREAFDIKLLDSTKPAIERLDAYFDIRSLLTFRQALFSQILIPVKADQRSSSRPARKRQAAAL